MILKDVAWGDSSMIRLIRRIRLSARGLRFGDWRPDPARKKEQREQERIVPAKQKKP